jgi:hypothetical protein
MKRTALLMVVVAGLALGDVSLTTLTRFSLPANTGTMEATMTSEYQGDKRNETGTTKMVGGLLGALAGKPNDVAQVTRLDKEVIWDIDNKGKSYTEKPLNEIEKAGSSVEVKTEGSGTPPSKYRITKADVSVKTTGQEKTINSFPCKEHVITFELVMEDTATKKTLSQVMTTDMWMTPLTEALRKAQAAQDSFNLKLAKKSGVQVAAQGNNQMGAEALVAAYGLDPAVTAAKMQEVSREMEKIKGYPVVMDLKWQLKGDSTPAAKTEEEPEEEPAQAPTGLGGLMGKLTAKITPQAPKSEPDVLFTSYVEVKAVSVSDIAAERFEVPAGYKLVKPK